MSQDIVLLNGSASSTSRSTFVANAVAKEAERAGLRIARWSLSDFDPGDVLFGRSAAPANSRFIEATRAALAFIVATPVYKGTYTGAVKAIIDLIPPDALVGRPALGIATARLAHHGVEVDRSFRALFAFFRARAMDTLVVLDDELQLGAAPGVLSIDADQRVRTAARALVAAAGGRAQTARHP